MNERADADVDRTSTPAISKSRERGAKQKAATRVKRDG
jgi:hypothetical protein